MTGQVRHTALASSICRMAGPVFPIGKNSSGSASRQAARSRQSMRILLLQVGYGSQERHAVLLQVSGAIVIVGAWVSAGGPGGYPLTNDDAHEGVPYAS